MKKLEDVLRKMEQHLDALDQINPSISSASVGWHIAHSLITVNTIVMALQHSDPSKYQYRFNVKRLVVMTMGKIPRGRGRAPEIVKPKNTYSQPDLAAMLQKTMEAIQILSSLQPNHYFDHPYFDMLNLKPTINFLAIHSNHHLKIITDIVKK